MNTYFLCGLKVASNLHFPELEPWDGDANRPSDLEFGVGTVSTLLNPDYETQYVQANGRSTYIRDLPMVGRLLVADGRRVIIEPKEGIDETRVRTNIIGTLQAVLWHQRGLLPLHASAVMIGERAVLIAGQSGDGKSVLAAALAQLGLALLCDDLAVIDARAEPARLLPGYQRVRLWQDACVALKVGDRAQGAAHTSGQKFILGSQGVPLQSPVEISDILVLEGPRANEFKLESMSVVPALKALFSVVHMHDAATALGRQQQVTFSINALISQDIRIQRLTMPDGLDRVRGAADAILAALGR